MKRLTRPLNSVRLRELLRSLSLRACFTKRRFSRVTRPLHFTPSCPSKPLDFSTSASTANRPSFKPERPETDTKPAELDPLSVKNFIHVENPNPNVVEASSDHNNIYDVSGAKESCREVEAVISYLKPQVAFLELCSSRVGVFNTRNVEDLKVPSVVEMVEMWRNKHNLFDILCIWLLALIASSIEVVPGSEFGVAYEEARKYDAEVILGDRPDHITCSRISGKMTLREKMRLLGSLCLQMVVWPSVEDLCKFVNFLKDMDEDDKLTRMMQELNEKFPTLFETIVDERDQYMSYGLLRTARKHSSVVAVVGRGHLPGIRKYWKQPVSINELTTIPPQKPTLSTGEILAYLAIAIAFVSGIVLGIYLASKK
ncbi:hypothetical protein GQ457_17G023630 [Hibiscus cannabinus]